MSSVVFLMRYHYENDELSELWHVIQKATSSYLYLVNREKKRFRDEKRIAQKNEREKEKKNQNPIVWSRKKETQSPTKTNASEPSSSTSSDVKSDGTKIVEEQNKSIISDRKEKEYQSAVEKSIEKKNDGDPDSSTSTTLSTSRSSSSENISLIQTKETSNPVSSRVHQSKKQSTSQPGSHLIEKKSEEIETKNRAKETDRLVLKTIEEEALEDDELLAREHFDLMNLEKLENGDIKIHYRFVKEQRIDLLSKIPKIYFHPLLEQTKKKKPDMMDSVHGKVLLRRTLEK